MDNKIYTQYLSAVSQQIDFLKDNGFPGLFTRSAEICEDPSSLLKVIKDSQKEGSGNFTKAVGEELVVMLPYAGTNFTIRILLSIHEPWVAPDFIFSDSEFMKNLTIEEMDDHIPSLNNWNYLSEDILSQLLSQILQLYKHYQLNNLKEKELLFFEYQSLLEDLELKEDDIEVSVSGGSSWFASILIRIPLSLKDVPPVLIEGKETSNLLHLRIRKDDGSLEPNVILSSQVEPLLENNWQSDLPSVPPGTSISDYVFQILTLLHEKIKYAVTCFEARKQFIADMLCQFSGSILEYDNNTFKEAAFLYEVNGFYFMINLSLPKFFPKEKPVLYMRSLYQTNTHGPISRSLLGISYNSKAASEEIISKLKAAILKAVPTFQSLNKKRALTYTTID